MLSSALPTAPASLSEADATVWDHDNIEFHLWFRGDSETSREGLKNRRRTVEKASL
jgi:hypothetical protein